MFGLWATGGAYISQEAPSPAIVEEAVTKGGA